MWVLFGGFGRGLEPDFVESAQQIADKATAPTAKGLRNRGFDVEVLVVRRDPAQVVTELARHHDVEVIVMGTRGHSTRRQWLPLWRSCMNRWLSTGTGCGAEASLGDRRAITEGSVWGARVFCIRRCGSRFIDPDVLECVDIEGAVCAPCRSLASGWGGHRTDDAERYDDEQDEDEGECCR